MLCLLAWISKEKELIFRSKVLTSYQKIRKKLLYQSKSSLKDFFYKIRGNIADCFKGKNLLWQGIMIVLTYIIVVSGFDWYWFRNFGATNFNVYIAPALIFGTFLPILLPLVFLLFRKMNLAWALAQAAFLGWLISSTYKAFTGRIPPIIGSKLVDISHGFRFGFMRGGIFWGWPSSHTTVAFAMALTLFTLYPKNNLVRALSILYAVYVGLSVSVSIHWFSEFVAGAILGGVIGIVVGKSFRDKVM